MSNYFEEGNWEEELEDIDNYIFHLILTKKQEKATKKVFAAIRKAQELGVSFFDNAGKLSAFNSNRVIQIKNEKDSTCFESFDEWSVDYSEELPDTAFISLNADKEIFFEPNVNFPEL